MASAFIFYLVLHYLDSSCSALKYDAFDISTSMNSADQQLENSAGQRYWFKCCSVSTSLNEGPFYVFQEDIEYQPILSSRSVMEPVLINQDRFDYSKVIEFNESTYYVTEKSSCERMFDQKSSTRNSTPFIEEWIPHKATDEEMPKSSQLTDEEKPMSWKKIQFSDAVSLSLVDAIFPLIAFGITGTVRSSEKVAFRMKIFIAFMILSTVLREVDCITHKILGTEDLASDSNYVGFESREEAVKDVTTILMSLNTQQMHVQLVYNKQSEEMISAISKVVTQKFCTVKLFMLNSNSSSIITEMVHSAKHMTLLALLPSSKILNIFHEIKQNRLDSHLTKWILVFDRNHEDIYKVANALRRLIFEGTVVKIAFWKEPGHFTLLTNQADEEGKMQFVSRRTVPMENHNNGVPFQNILQPDDLSPYSNMRGRQLTIAAKSILPFFWKIDHNPDGSVKSASGIDYSILRSLSSFHNFTYRIIGPPDGAFGYPEPDGTITGMIGMAARREINLAVTGIGANDKRDTVVDFTVPYMQGSLGIYSRAPKQKSSTMAVLSPFTPEVWLCIICSTLLMGLLLWVQSYFLTYLKEDDPKWTLKDYTFNVFRSLMVQSNLLSSKRWPHRFLFFSWYLFCLIASALYSGTLTAVLAVPAYEKPVDSLLDLPRAIDEGFTLTVTKDSTNEYIFREAKEGIYKEVWGLFNHKDPSKSFVSSPAAGLNMILESGVIHICLEVVAKVVVAGLGRNKFHFSREIFFPQNVVFVVPPGAPYKESFSQVIQKLIEGGFIGKWEDDEIQKISQKSSGDEELLSTGQVFSLSHLQAAFFVILSGYMVAALVLLMEKIYSKY